MDLSFPVWIFIPVLNIFWLLCLCAHSGTWKFILCFAQRTFHTNAYIIYFKQLLSLREVRLQSPVGSSALLDDSTVFQLWLLHLVKQRELIVIINMSSPLTGARKPLPLSQAGHDSCKWWEVIITMEFHCYHNVYICSYAGLTMVLAMRHLAEASSTQGVV